MTLSANSGGCGGTWTIYSTNNNLDVIEYVRTAFNEGACSSTVYVVENPDSGRLIKTVEEFTQVNGSSNVLLGSLQVGTDVGSATAWQIGTIDAGGDITGDITGTNSGSSTGISNVFAGDDILGDVVAANGRILAVEAGGDIGTSLAPVSITSRYDTTRVIADAIYANINTTANSGTGSFGRLETTVGNFVGTLTTHNLTTVGTDSDLVIAGDLDADLTVNNVFDSTMLIEGDLTAASVIAIDDGGLQG